MKSVFFISRIYSPFENEPSLTLCKGRKHLPSPVISATSRATPALLAARFPTWLWSGQNKLITHIFSVHLCRKGSRSPPWGNISRGQISSSLMFPWPLSLLEFWGLVEA